MPISLNKKAKTISAVILCLAATLPLYGCSLTQGDFSLAREELDSTQDWLAEDRLAGIFVTENYIEPPLPQLELNARGEIIAQSQEPQKIYGSLTGFHDMAQPPVSFPSLEGYGLYNLELSADETHEAAGYTTGDAVFTDLHYTVSDQEDSVEASLYVTAGSPQNYYFHPVYQQADGQVYLLPGSGVSTDSFAEGQSFSHSVSQSVSRTENGKESAAGYRFTVTIVAAELPADRSLLFLDDNDQVVQRLSGRELDALFQADVPQLTVPEGVSYLILSQAMASQAQNTHTVYDYGSEYLEYMTVQEGSQLLCPRQLQLLWQ